MEQWRSVKGYEGLYEVSNLGNVRSVDRATIHKDGKQTTHKGKLLKIGTDSRKGYRIVYLSKDGKKRTVKVHRLVAIAFISNPLDEEWTEFEDYYLVCGTTI